MKPIWRRIGSEIVILAEREYRFNWRDADVASALYLSLLADHENSHD